MPVPEMQKRFILKKAKAWIDAQDEWKWLNDNKEFTIVSDKDGWNHLYRISIDGKKRH
ncbi:DPP IV N-terminal domain-containing protein [Pedobacter sp. P26]|uniref:DPP IV N-terminal domain-containing protein n=1 Tax=Pedobacter sp. P26 TaxID=3423956 RepID=UPI003D67C239